MHIVILFENNPSSAPTTTTTTSSHKQWHYVACSEIDKVFCSHESIYVTIKRTCLCRKCNLVNILVFCIWYAQFLIEWQKKIYNIRAIVIRFCFYILVFSFIIIIFNRWCVVRKMQDKKWRKYDKKKTIGIESIILCGN